MRLYSKILLWFFLNLVVLALVVYGFLRLQFRMGFESMLMGQAGERIQAVSEVLAKELDSTPPAAWETVLDRFSHAYQVRFLLFYHDCTQVAGPAQALPAEVQAKLAEARGPFGGPGRGPPMGRGYNRANMELRVRFLVRCNEPPGYWAGTSLPMLSTQARGRLMLLIQSDSIYAGGFFLDLKPWLVVGGVALLLSLLLWLPLARGITRSVTRMTNATERIAEGQFDARVGCRRKDELGRVGHAIDRLAARLEGFVSGQKRFLGDIAHELCSPIARAKLALEVLDGQVAAQQKPLLQDVREELEHMSNLVNELLAFSKAALKAQEIQLVPVEIAPLVQRVVDREAREGVRLELDLAHPLVALAEPELLSRALGNLLRNAVRYAGQAGPIVVSASAREGRIVLVVSDCGPGVPQETLEQIFDPFFRVEASRSRETGGIGLGLAIVKSCAEACQGSVVARNRLPAGLEVQISLLPAGG